MPTFEVTETIANPESEPLDVWFEPWCARHSLAAGRSFRVVAVSARPGSLEFVRDNDGLTVYAWPGATMRIYCDDQLVDDFSIPFPDIPDGMNMRSFLDLMFGKPRGQREG
jgi:hypothetical protein